MQETDWVQMLASCGNILSRDRRRKLHIAGLPATAFLASSFGERPLFLAGRVVFLSFFFGGFNFGPKETRQK